MLESVPWYIILFWGIIGIVVVIGFIWKVILYSAAGGFMGFLFAVGPPIIKILITIVWLFILMIFLGTASLLLKILLGIILFILGIVLMFIWDI